MIIEDIKGILDSIPSQIAVLNSDGTIIQVNESWTSFARKNGRPQELENGIGTNYLDVCQRADGLLMGEALTINEGIRTVINGNQAEFVFEYPCYSLKEQRWFLTTVLPYKGVLGCVVITHIDITERKLAEIRQTSFDQILKQSFNEIYIFDVERLKFIEVNEGAQKNLGYSLHELQSMTPVDIKPTHTKESFTKIIDALRAGRQDKLLFTTEHERKDGTVYPVEVHLQISKLDNRSVFVAITLDITQRKQTEEREAAFGTVLETSTNEILMFNAQTLNFEHANRGARENLGYSMDELRQLSPLDIKPEFTPEIFEALLQPLRNNEREKINFTTVHRRKDGTTYPIEAHVQCAIFNSKPVFAQIILDITERTLAQEALAQSRLFLESAPDASIIVNDAGKVVVANSRMSALFGYTSDELRNMQIELLIPQRFRDKHVLHRNTFSADPKLRDMGADLELFAVTKNGQEIPIEVSLSPIKTDKSIFVAAAIRDISKRKLREQALRDSEERYRELFENAGDLIQSVRADGSFIYVNPAWCKTLGYDHDDIKSLTMFDVIHPDEHDHCRSIFGQIMAGNFVEKIKTKFIAKNGDIVLLEGNATCAIKDDMTVATRAIFHDITQRVKAELLIKESKEIAEKATVIKSRLMAAANHDLRQPLQSIGLYVSSLDQTLEDQSSRIICKKIRNSLDVMGELLDALLDISKLDNGSIIPSRKDFSIQTLFDQLIANNEPQAKEKSLTFTCKGTSCMLHSDPALLLRIVENFVTNAIRYTETGNVDVCCEIRGENARIEVRDSGVGIPKQALDTIFDEYFQLDNPERNRNMGLGLGLSIAKHIGLLLGHRLEVTSILGEGTIFSVDVPLGEVINQVVKVPKLDEVINFQKHCPVVLFIDDDPAIVDATTMLLNICGFQVHSALNGDEAMAHLANGVHPDIVISDYRLPGNSGIEVIRRIRQVSIDELPAILITGDTSSQEIATAKLSKCTLLHKPVDTDHLISLIETLTAKSVVA